MFEIVSFFHYWLNRVDEHSLHSPFVYNLFTEVISRPNAKDNEIEFLRQQLRYSKKAIEVVDFGAGSKLTKKTNRSIGGIAKHASTPSKFSRFLSKTIDHFGFCNIVELGTSLGLNALYLSQNQNTQVTTFEGDPTIAQLAQGHFEAFGRKKVNTIVGNIDSTLPQYIDALNPIDLAYLDANHRYSPTLNYYELIQPMTHDKSMIVIDDIHWSKEMNKAWLELKDRPEVTLSIDLFEAGLLFFDPKLEKADYILKF
ncbi:O-methyltransferase [Roseivirga sp. E12]|uniref:O-methyltransferase n=1 Tax=Roseivirga sp. E12 TaxID=2819237 RepID=UPI001ABC390B|nr:class I SAM-dependent methyltransferase [Roseivirga sp. E12]MBO3698343.1 class I SAM-dependent methyltransferase [Roseivirga sp. E12]